eukprot:3076918-Rhodomonas_salina.1
MSSTKQESTLHSRLYTLQPRGLGSRVSDTEREGVGAGGEAGRGGREGGGHARRCEEGVSGSTVYGLYGLRSTVYGLRSTG